MLGMIGHPMVTHSGSISISIVNPHSGTSDCSNG